MNGMVAQVHSIPELIRSVTRRYDDTVRSILSPDLLKSVGRIYLVGCGDSNHVSIGSELAYEQLTGLPTEALTSMQFGRYAAETMPGFEPASNLVIGISVSGEVARTLEAVLTARKSGATTLGLTATPGSR